MNNKAQEILGFMTAFAVLVAVSVFFYYYYAAGQPENFIGQAPLQLLIAAKEAEKAQLYVEQSAAFSTVHALQEVAKDSSVCGRYFGSSVWSNKTQECSPSKEELTKRFANAVNKELNPFLVQYKGAFIPQNNYELSITEKVPTLFIKGTAKEDLVVSSGIIFPNVRVTRYYAPYELDFQKWSTGVDYKQYPQADIYAWCVVPQKLRGFYEEVQCQGSGVSSTGKIYSYSLGPIQSIQPTPEASKPVEKISTKTNTEATPHRTIAVAEDMIPYGSRVKIEFVGCRDQACCDAWNGDYIAEDTGAAMINDWKRGIAHIDLYTGVGRKMFEESACLPDLANLNIISAIGDKAQYTYKIKPNFKTSLAYSFDEYKLLNDSLLKLSDQISKQCYQLQGQETLNQCINRILSSDKAFEWSFECGTDEEKVVYSFLEAMHLCTQTEQEGYCIYEIPSLSEKVDIEFSLDQITKLTSVTSASIRENLSQVAPYFTNKFTESKPELGVCQTLTLTFGNKETVVKGRCGNQDVSFTYRNEIPLYSKRLSEQKGNFILFIDPLAYQNNKENINKLTVQKKQLRICAQSKQYTFLDSSGKKAPITYKISFFAGDAVPPAEVKNIIIADTLRAEENITIAFDANTEEDMSHYDLYYAAKAFSKTDEEGVQKIGSILHEKGKAKYETTVKLPNDGTFYFAVTAVDTSKNEGIFVAKEGNSKDDLNPGPVQKVEYTKPGLAPIIDFTVTPPVLNEDGSPLKDLESYKIYAREAVGGACLPTDIAIVLTNPKNVFRIKDFEKLSAKQHITRNINLQTSGKQYCIVAIADDEVEEEAVQTTQYSENSSISVQT